MNDAENKKIAYLILQYKYYKSMGCENLSEEEILRKYPELFPEMWELMYSTDQKIEYISKAIKENKSLVDIVSRDKVI